MREDGIGGDTEEVGKKPVLCVGIVGDCPGTGITAGGDETAHLGEFTDIFCGGLPDGGYRCFVKSAFTPEVAYGGEGWHPDSAVFFHGKEGIVVLVGAMLHGIHPGRSGSLYSTGAVGMSHDRKALLVGDVNQFVDLGRGQTFFGENTGMVKIHEAGDHDFDKIGTVFTVLFYKGGIVGQGLPGFADESAIVTLLAQGGKGCAVGDAVLGGDVSGGFACAPAVAAVPEVSEALGLVLR